MVGELFRQTMEHHLPLSVALHIYHDFIIRIHFVLQQELVFALLTESVLKRVDVLR